METEIETAFGDIVNAFVATSTDAAEASRPLLVAIAGIPGSGKTTLAKALANALEDLGNDAITTEADLNNSGAFASGSVPNDSMPQRPMASASLGSVFVLSMDGYHHTRAELDAMKDPVEAHRRRGAHWTFDANKFLSDLKTLKATGVLSAPTFDHAKKDPTPDGIRINARTETHPVVDRETGEVLGADVTRSIVSVEGLYLALRDPAVWASVNDQFDLVIFIQCSLEVATERLVRRHMAAWGIPREEALERASGSDRENALLVLDTAINAHIAVDSVEDDAFIANLSKVSA
jgi:pantothenate kinase